MDNYHNSPGQVSEIVQQRLWGKHHGK